MESAKNCVVIRKRKKTNYSESPKIEAKELENCPSNTDVMLNLVQPHLRAYMFENQFRKELPISEDF